MVRLRFRPCLCALLTLCLVATSAMAQNDRNAPVPSDELIDEVFDAVVSTGLLNSLMLQVPECQAGSVASDCRRAIAQAFLNARRRGNATMMLVRYWNYVQTAENENGVPDTAAYIHSPLTIAGVEQDWELSSAPMLMLACTARLGLSLSINWTTDLNLPDPSVSRVPVTLQVDTDAARRENWTTAMQRHYTTYPGNTRARLNQLMQNDELRAQATAANGRTYDVTFDLRGLKDVAPLVLDDCLGR